MTLVHFLLFSCVLLGTSLKHMTLTSEVKVTRGRKVAITLNHWYGSYITGLLHHSTKCVKYLQVGCIEASCVIVSLVGMYFSDAGACEIVWYLYMQKDWFYPLYLTGWIKM